MGPSRPVSLRAELQILADVASYRLRRLEMANLGGAAAIAIALHLSVSEIGLRLVFGLLLNLLVYLNNDYVDGDADLAATGREHDKTAFLMAHRSAALRAQLGLLAALAVLAAWHGAGLWIPLWLGGGVCWAYSVVLKRRPGVDVLAMMAWGVAMPMVGVPPAQLETALPLLVMLGLFSGVFESVQVLRDREDDRARGVRTTAVVWGPTLTLGLVRGIAGLAAVHAWWCFGIWVALPCALAAAGPAGIDRPVTLWNRMRALCGLTFVLACARVWSGG